MSSRDPGRSKTRDIQFPRLSPVMACAVHQDQFFKAQCIDSVPDLIHGTHPIEKDQAVESPMLTGNSHCLNA